MAYRGDEGDALESGEESISEKTRGVTFEKLLESRFLGMERYRTRDNQDLMLFEYKQRVWLIPYVEDAGCYFLKTALPGRKYLRIYSGA